MLAAQPIPFEFKLIYLCRLTQHQKQIHYLVHSVQSDFLSRQFLQPIRQLLILGALLCLLLVPLQFLFEIGF